MFTFPSVAIAMGGAEWAKYSHGSVRVKVPGLPEAVRLDPADLPPPEHWTAFSLADAVHAKDKKGGAR